MNKKSKIQGHFRLLSGQDDDLIIWWKSLNDLPYGIKGQTIKDVLRKGLGISEPGSTGAGELGGSIPAQDNLLLDIRRVVEAAVTEVLNQGQIAIQKPPDNSREPSPDEAAKVSQLMAEIDRNLLLPEDEEDL